MNLSLHFANKGEAIANVSVISAFIYLFIYFLLGMKHLFLLLRKPSQSSSIFLMLDAVHEQIVI